MKTSSNLQSKHHNLHLKVDYMVRQTIINTYCYCIYHDEQLQPLSWHSLLFFPKACLFFLSEANATYLSQGTSFFNLVDTQPQPAAKTRYSLISMGQYYQAVLYNEVNYRYKKVEILSESLYMWKIQGTVGKLKSYSNWQQEMENMQYPTLKR